ncbi:unnamed protein product [Oncorhynchus mykiss]|uniref:Syntaphilin a n=1 Tax=Oncorhynchus mykiss TaxID=8022 RepID=A0A060W649_ONCMY|nr:unnamed protein product [Oncorhynchus mykiss]
MFVHNVLCSPSLSHLPSFPLGASSRWSTPMSLPQSRKPSAGQRRRPVATSSGRHSYSDASNTNTYPGRASEGSPTARTYPGPPKHQVKHATCSDNHGIWPPTPEQYLTPLQQKEVCIRHLRARLRENVQRLQHRDSEIAEMKTQLCRMQEDWIVEECHRVEAQLALKQARREIQHLHEVVETVRSNLGTPEKAPYDKKPYLSPQRPRPTKSRSCGCSPASTLSRSTAYTRLSSEALYVDRNGNAPGPDLHAAAQRLCSGGAVLPVSHSCHSLSNSCRCMAQTCQPKPGPMLSPERQGGEEGVDGAPQRNFWSRYFLVDLLAVAMPVVPTVAWLCHGAPREVMPVYHIGSLLRGCCAVALHSLRRGGRGPTSMNGASNI